MKLLSERNKCQRVCFSKQRMEMKLIIIIRWNFHVSTHTHTLSHPQTHTNTHTHTQTHTHPLDEWEFECEEDEKRERDKMRHFPLLRRAQKMSNGQNKDVKSLFLVQLLFCAWIKLRSSLIVTLIRDRAARESSTGLNRNRMPMRRLTPVYLTWPHVRPT